MKNFICLLALAATLFSAGCHRSDVQKVTFVGGTSRWIFSNGILTVVVKSSQGTYEIFRNADQKRIITGAYLRIDGDSTNETGRKPKYDILDFFHGPDTGKFLLITSSKEGRPGLGLRFGLLPGKDFVVIDGGIMNLGTTAMQVKEISVVTNGLLYGGKKLTPGFRMLDGNGGGEDTRVTEGPVMACRNNFMLTWGEQGKREVLVAGGLTYREIEKFVRVAPAVAGSKAAGGLPPGLKLLAHLDAGKDIAAGKDPLSLKVEKGSPYQWGAGLPVEYDDVLFDKNEVVITVTGLAAGTAASIGLGWSDDAETRKQSVAWSVDGGPAIALLAPVQLPSHGAGQSPAQIWLNLPPAALTGDTLRVHIRNEGGVNAVISDFLLCEGSVPEKEHGSSRPLNANAIEPENLLLNLYAGDPVGKRVDPGQSWFPDDAFYISASLANPFEALEQYGDVLKDFQQISLEYYTFPTVCLWYAQHKAYGDGPSVNDAPGAVAEMERAVKSGFLRYSPVSIRLVPDAYEENNEQGWWDEKHWQMYGTGKYSNPPDGNVDVAPGHYKKPYETTRKWAQAIIERGGIPLTYFQTGRRSDDYAAAFPGHMLFNNQAGAVTNPDWMIKGKVSYDFTDTDFLQHMQDVYKNLNDGGVQGLMYDYPYTGWAQYGGMDDVYSTTAAAYRTIFQLARTGLGPEAFLDERNLDHGSDITLGIVSSQRIWGDTDRMSPLMISRGALRWYKNRKVVSYDMDAKNLLKAQPAGTDGIRKMLTLMYATCGRFLMANSFDRLSPELVHDLSRIFPYPDSWISARPADAFISKFPELFVFKIDTAWHQVAAYNPDDRNPSSKTILFGSPDYFGAFQLDPAKQYYAYEFWDNRLAGRFRGGDSLRLDFRPGEAKMLAIREVLDHPQLLSTDRHLMQGLVETRNLKWDAAKSELSGEVNLVDGEPITLVLAANGYTIEGATAEAETVTVSSGDDGLVRVELVSGKGGWSPVLLKFLKN
jgi:hypothetical protein